MKFTVWLFAEEQRQTFNLLVFWRLCRQPQGLILLLLGVTNADRFRGENCRLHRVIGKPTICQRRNYCLQRRLMYSKMRICLLRNSCSFVICRMCPRMYLLWICTSSRVSSCSQTMERKTIMMGRSVAGAARHVSNE